MFEIFGRLIVETQPSAQPLSPEQMAGVILAIQKAAHGTSGSWLSPEGATAFSALISALASFAWPIVFFIGVLAFRPQVRQLLGRVTEGEAFGIKFKIEKELAKSAEEASEQTTNMGPTSGEIERAGQVAKLASQTGASTILDQIEQLAVEYESIRATLPSGPGRTRVMNGIAAKMRTIGVAASRFRYELAASPSPGKRLQAIACLQVAPDLDMICWLVERVITEVPFVSYQALIAIDSLAKSANARSHIRDFEVALKRFDAPPPGFENDPPRVAMLRQYRETFQTLRGA